MTKYRKSLINLTLSAMFLAIGLLLPFLTGQIPEIGNMLLPMHIPVLLCGLICDWKHGLAVGFITPLLRSLLFGRPVLYPSAIAMAFELATYGAVVGILYAISNWKCIVSLYRSLIGAMIAGRLVFGAVKMILLGIKGNAYTWSAFIADAFLEAIPGIIIQLILIPAIMVALDKAKLVKFTKKANKTRTVD